MFFSTGPAFTTLFLAYRSVAADDETTVVEHKSQRVCPAAECQLASAARPPGNSLRFDLDIGGHADIGIRRQRERNIGGIGPGGELLEIAFKINDAVSGRAS